MIRTTQTAVTVIQGRTLEPSRDLPAGWDSDDHERNDDRGKWKLESFQAVFDGKMVVHYAYWSRILRKISEE